MEPKRGLARYLRQNMTKPEVLLWLRLKNDQLGFRFKRQFAFDRFVLDFYCANLKVDVEIDGKDHRINPARDQERDAWLQSQGVVIYRIPAKEVLRDPDVAAMKLKDFLIELKADNK